MFYEFFQTQKISQRVNSCDWERHASDLELNKNNFNFYIKENKDDYKAKEINITLLVKISEF